MGAVDETVVTLSITPATLREIADDLEQQGPHHCRTVVSDEGYYIDIVNDEVDLCPL